MNFLLADAYGFRETIRSGVATANRLRAVALTRQGHKVTVLTHGEWSETRRYGVSVVSMPLLVPFSVHTPLKTAIRVCLNAPSVLTRLRQLLVREQVHVIDMTYHSHLFWLSAVGRFVGVPRILNFHGTEVNAWEKIPVAHRMLALFTVRSASIVTFVSESLREIALSRWPDLSKRSAVVYNFVPETDISIQHHSGDVPSRYVVCVGMLEKVKGQDVLLSAWQCLQMYHGDVTLVLVGSGSLEETFKKFVLDQGLSDSVIFAGHCSRSDTLSWIAGAEFLVLPSRSEGLPYVLLEAGALGIPVVATRVGGVGEVITDGATGLLVQAEEPTALARAMGRLLNDARLRGVLGARLYKTIQQKFSLEAWYDAYMDCVARCTSTPQGHSCPRPES